MAHSVMWRGERHKQLPAWVEKPPARSGPAASVRTPYKRFGDPVIPPATLPGERMRPGRLAFIRSIDASFPIQKGENSPLALVQELLAELDAWIDGACPP